jgi:V/A-type H+/Na+-transporting ATPase subunit C
MMWPSRGKKGNYAYACARVRAKKSALLGKDTFPKFLMMDLNEIGRFLGETNYETEMTELGARYEGVNLIELGTSRNLARIYKEILGFTQGELREMVASYLNRWDQWNVKTILRGKYYGATVDEVREDLVPAGKLKEEDLNVLLSLGSISEILDALKSYGMAIPEEVRAEYDAAGTLEPVEDYLDREYYADLLATIGGGNAPGARFLMLHIRREIDETNLMTLLKLKLEGLSAEKINGFFIEGGEEFDKAEFARLASVENAEQLADELGKFSFYEELKDELERMKQTKSATGVSLAMKRYTLKKAETFSHLYPLSILPIIDYLIRKKNEVDNIRIIARSKESGIDPELIKRLLVI